jgi:hypothetical protein
MPIAQTDIISGCISDLKGVRRSGGALRRYRHSGLAAVMQRASPRGVLPQGIRTELKTSKLGARVMHRASLHHRVIKATLRIARSIGDAPEPAGLTPTLGPLARRTPSSIFRQVTKWSAGT